jgi:hypothetical protein
VAHELLGEDLGALYAGRGPRGTEDVQAGLPERLGDAPDQGGFGTDDGQIDLIVGSVVSKGDQVVYGYVYRLGDA